MLRDQTPLVGIQHIVGEAKGADTGGTQNGTGPAARVWSSLQASGWRWLNDCMLIKPAAWSVECVSGKTPGELHSQLHEDIRKAEHRVVSSGWTICSSSVQPKGTWQRLGL